MSDADDPVVRGTTRPSSRSVGKAYGR